MNLRIGILATCLMLVANAGLLWRDVIPRWTAGPPPKRGVEQISLGSEQKAQVAIYDASGVIIGRSWTVALRNLETLSVRTTTQFDRATVGRFTFPARVTVINAFYYNNDNELDSIDVAVYGLGVSVSLRGEYVPPDSFPCQWQLDELKGTFVLEGAATKLLSDSTRPFDRLPDLTVGQTWRIELFNPLSASVPGLEQAGWRTEPVYVRVSGREKIQHRAQDVEAFVVEAERIRAWVAPDGQVLRQEVYFPLLGQLTLLDEPYDELSHRTAMQKMSQADAQLSHEQR